MVIASGNLHEGEKGEEGRMIFVMEISVDFLSTFTFLILLFSASTSHLIPFTTQRHCIIDCCIFIKLVYSSIMNYTGLAQYVHSFERPVDEEARERKPAEVLDAQGESRYARMSENLLLKSMTPLTPYCLPL